jgi:hypothetical protein
MTEADAPWWFDLFKKRYSQSRYDTLTTYAWMTEFVLKDPKMFLPIRTDNALLIAIIHVVPWLLGSEVQLVALIADEGAVWECPALLRASIEWANLRNAKRWRFSARTENDAIIGPLMRRIGAHEDSPHLLCSLAESTGS